MREGNLAEEEEEEKERALGGVRAAEGGGGSLERKEIGVCWRAAIGEFFYFYSLSLYVLCRNGGD